MDLLKDCNTVLLQLNALIMIATLQLLWCLFTMLKHRLKAEKNTVYHISLSSGLFLLPRPPLTPSHHDEEQEIEELKNNMILSSLSSLFSCHSVSSLILLVC